MKVTMPSDWLLSSTAFLELGSTDSQDTLDSSMPLALAKAGNISRGESPGEKAIFLPSRSFGFVMLLPLM